VPDDQLERHVSDVREPHRLPQQGVDAGFLSAAIAFRRLEARQYDHDRPRMILADVRRQIETILDGRCVNLNVDDREIVVMNLEQRERACCRIRCVDDAPVTGEIRFEGEHDGSFVVHYEDAFRFHCAALLARSAPTGMTREPNVND
jgi:hypothetical protein